MCPVGFTFYLGKCYRGVTGPDLAAATAACKDQGMGVGKIVDGPGNPVIK